MANPTLTEILPFVRECLAKQPTPTSASEADRQRLKEEFDEWVEARREHRIAHYLVAACRKAGVQRRHINHLPDIQFSGQWADTLNSLAAGITQGPTKVLLGPRGCGKTQMALWMLADIALAKIIVGKDNDQRYVKAENLFVEIRDAFERKDEETLTVKQVIAKYTTPSLLIIDEAHDRGHSAFEARTFNNIIDERYGAGDRATVFISNQTREEFGAAIGPSIISRIHEDDKDGTGVVLCGWASFREAKSA